MSFDGLLGGVALLVSVAVGFLGWRLSRPIRAELADLQSKYNILMLDYWKSRGEVAWLRRVLYEHGIEIPPLPEEYRPHTDKNGQIVINLSMIGPDAQVEQIAVGQTLKQEMGR